MICIIQMDKGTPNTNPQPTGWIIANDFVEAEKMATDFGQYWLAKWLKDKDGMLEGRCRWDLEAPEGRGQTFVLHT